MRIAAFVLVSILSALMVNEITGSRFKITASNEAHATELMRLTRWAIVAKAVVAVACAAVLAALAVWL